MKFEVCYIKTFRSGGLAKKVEEGLNLLRSCTTCPRSCKINRLEGEKGVCKTGRYAFVSSHFAHRGEEDCLRGWNGSGTIFFSQCSLRCIFCQNYDISHGGEGREVTPDLLAQMMLDLQERGCYNINLVTPSHIVPQILEALLIAIPAGLKIPLVYNTGGYDNVTTLKLMDGVVDIYMPDFKFWRSEESGKYCNAPDYPEIAKAAVREMHRQVGDLMIDRSGLARRGLLTRHLVMPNVVAGSEGVFKFLAGEISKDTYINILAQYHPSCHARQYPEIARPVHPEEVVEAYTLARRVGLHRFDRPLLF